MLIGIFNSFPRFDFNRHLKSFCFCIINSHKNIHSTISDTSDFPAFCVHNRSFFFKYILIHIILLLLFYNISSRCIHPDSLLHFNCRKQFCNLPRFYFNCFLRENSTKPYACACRVKNFCTVY